jgi:cyanophycin synthetase
MAAQGDLVLIFGDQIQRTWKQIIYFNRAEPEEPAKGEAPAPESPAEPDSDDPLGGATPVPDAPDIPESLLLGGIRMVRDSRGVRVETEPEEAD